MFEELRVFWTWFWTLLHNESETMTSDLPTLVPPSSTIKLIGCRESPRALEEFVGLVC